MKTNYENVIVVDHPLCEHNMTHIRDKNASADSFINSLKRVAQILMYTATKELPLECCQIQTPIAECDSLKIDESYKIVFAPILRAGLALSEVAKEIFEFTGRLLGEKFADFIAFSAPEAIIMFGGLTKAGDLLMEPVKRHMEENVLAIWKNKVKVLFSELKEADAAVLGASALAWEL